MSAILVIQHVPHEGLGTFEDVFRQAGCSVQPLLATDPRAKWPTVSKVDGIVSMGGPQSVYEQARHSYLTKEIALLKQAVKAGTPVLGVCLGAQLLAAALGAKVTKNTQKEIGWYPLMREPRADGDPLCEPFGQTETVFHWHWDTFSLPKGAVRLFSSPLCQEQAFRYGERAWGLQFHVEVTEAMIRAWIRANKAELECVKSAIPPPVGWPTASRRVVAPARRIAPPTGGGISDPAVLLRENRQHLPRLQELARHVASTFGRMMTPVSTI